MPLTLSLAREADEAARDGHQLDYLPFGVKTLKVRVDGDYRGKLRLAPKRLSGVAGEKLGHEDGDAAPRFVVSWGGGHEDYFALDYPRKRFVHFLVRHVGQGQDEATLTIEARDRRGLQADLPVRLTYPTVAGQPWPADRLVRATWQEVRPGLNGSADILLAGEMAPRYVARWWPHNRVAYAYDRRPPRLRLHYRRVTAGVNGEITVYAARPDGDGERPLAVVRGSLAYPLYDMRQVAAELFRFGPQTWVARVWFFWLDLDISRQDLGRYWRRSPAELEEAWLGIAATAAGGLASRGWGQLHEVPDAERVDVLFNDDMQPLYVATDLHWRELWGAYGAPDEPVQVQILNTQAARLRRNWRETRKVVEGWGSIVLSRLAQNQPPYRPHLEVAADLAGQSKLAADPIAMESHSPAFLNVRLQTRFTSTDVTDG